MAETYRDAWGIPHLRAASHLELARLQGRNAVADRGAQLEVERHRSLGTSAALLGPAPLGWDRFARQVRLDDTARRCFEGLDPGTAAWVEAYVEGVNAGLTGTAGTPAQGPWQAWTPLAIWLSHHVLFAGFPAKLWRDEVATRLGEHVVDLFATDGPAAGGSNGWLVTGEHTAGGGALLAGDPHRFLEDPGVYQQLHLACDEYDVVGLAVPGVPGLAHFGHTGTVAWAITNAMADYQDLYVEQLRRTASRVEALGPQGWEPVDVQVETVDVADGESVEVEVLETARGPVVVSGPGDRALSLRCPARVLSDCGFAALPALLRATTVSDVDHALDRWVEPVNVVLAADTRGDVLHRVAGRVPLRDPANSRRPVPAWSAEHAWQGWQPMPRAAVDGFAVMANERGLAEPLGVEFAPPHRAHRIGDLLAERHGWTADDMAAIHMDTHLGSCGPLLDVLAEVPGPGPEAELLRDRLLRWDRRMDGDSTTATAYAALRRLVVLGMAEHPVLKELVGFEGYPESLQPWLEVVPRIGHALEHLVAAELIPTGDLRRLVGAALEEVAHQQLPPWREVHRLLPWQARPQGGAEWPGVAGDHDCVLSTSGVPGVTERCVRGPAARYVWDVDDRDRSRWVVPLGASGIPGHPHQRDQLPRWLSGELVPVITDWNRLTKERDVS